MPAPSGPRSPRRRARRWLVVLSGCTVAPAALLVVALAAMNDPNPVGHFRSAEGRRAYEASYAAAMAGLPAPGRTLDVSTSFGIVRVYEFASTRSRERLPAVLLPGRSAGAPMWASNLPGLAEERTVYAMDALGDAGMSVQARAIGNGADQAAWLDETIAALRFPKVHLVGHSFGGWLAANYAVRRPERAATLTLLEPVFVFQGLRWQVYAWSLPASLPFVPHRWRDRMLSRLGGAGELDRQDPLARMISDATEHFSVKLPLPERITDEQLRALRMPVYAAIGARSPMHDPAAAAAVARACLKDARVEVWPGASHSLPMEFPERLDREVLDFMAAHDGR